LIDQFEYMCARAASAVFKRNTSHSLSVFEVKLKTLSTPS